MSGGAPLDLNVAKFFQRVGIQVYEVYGLTETSPIATINIERNRDLRSVGKPLPSYEAKTDPETGELLLKGPSVMKGYHNQPELTREAVDEDGWFHTGDIAKIDESGRVYITGRIKNMIVLSGGKKVFPEEVESVLEKATCFQKSAFSEFQEKAEQKTVLKILQQLLFLQKNLEVNITMKNLTS